ncbi:MAG: methyltransferase domain-containing protein [Clostridia bacterium]
MTPSPEILKGCCATAYASPWVSLVLGESWHPGGLELTERVGRYLALTPADVVGDVAAGEGASGRHLARRFGCRVQALDLGGVQVARARERAGREGLADRMTFQQGDAEALPWADASLDAVLCECALCTFPSPAAAVAEWARVLKPGGRIGLTDVTRRGALPSRFDTLAGWIGCLAGARTLDAYEDLLTGAGLKVQVREDRSGDLEALVTRIGTALLAWLKVQGPTGTLGGWTRADVEHGLGVVRSAIADGDLGYGLLIARRSA